MNNIEELFVGWFNYSNSEYEEILKNAYISFDTNVLLNLYRYSKETSLKTISLFKSIENRLVISYYAAFEFTKNRKKVESDSIYEYKKYIEKIDGGYDNIINELSKISDNKISKNKLIESILKNRDKVLNAFECEIKKKEELFEDGLEKNICDLINGKILNKFNDHDFQKIKSEGLRRFKECIPPGYKDSDKPENGDYYIFKSLIDFAKKSKCNLIFVTDDLKEDMFVNINGIKSARPELLNEFYEETGQKLVIMSLQHFLKNKIIFNINISDSILEEIRNISLENQNISVKTHARIRKFIYNALKYDNCEDVENNIVNIKKSLRTAIRICEGINDEESAKEYNMYMRLLDFGEYKKYIVATQSKRVSMISLKNKEYKKVILDYEEITSSTSSENKVKYIDNLILYISEYMSEEYESKNMITKLRDLNRSIKNGYISNEMINEELHKIYIYITKEYKNVSI